MENVEGRSDIDSSDGYSRYRDHVTAELGLLASARDSMHKEYISLLLRSKHGSPPLETKLAQAAEDAKKIVRGFDRDLVKTLKRHALWDWLEPHPGVRGAHIARLISMIGDPHRFPGRLCEDGHHLPSDWVGDCGKLCGEKGEAAHVCGAAVGPVRRGTGTRSVWHYFGVHVDANGRAPKMRKGQQCTWTPMGRACLLQPDGIADQIVRWRVEPWRGKYEATKQRVSFERGIVPSNEIEQAVGEALEGESNAESTYEAGNGSGIAESGGAAERVFDGDVSNGKLRPFQIDAIAKKVAVKAFVADLLMAWKERAACRPLP